MDRLQGTKMDTKTVLITGASSGIDKETATRYAAGKYAKSLLFLRRWVSDRAFARVIGSMIR